MLLFEDLRQLCISYDWFTCGSTAQYDKLAFLVNQYNNGKAAFHDIILTIWLCSDDRMTLEAIGSIVERYVR